MRRHHLLAAAALACFACARSELSGFPQGNHPSSGSTSSGHSASASSGTGTVTTGTHGTVGTTGTVGTSGTVGTIGTDGTVTTGTTTGGLPICAPCADGTQCASGYCNTFTGPGPFCDDPNWCTVDSVCSPVTQCNPQTGACQCPPGTTGTVGTVGTIGTTGTTGTIGGECAPCQQDVDCAPGGYCVPDPLSGQSECSAPCGPGDTCSDPNSTCFHLRGRSGCFPSSFTCSGNTTGNFTTGTTGNFSTGTTGTFTTGTSGTTGTTGGECAPCLRDADCVPGGYCVVRNAGPNFCTVPCINGGCMDPNATCQPIFNGTTNEFGCVPNGGCPSTIGTTGTSGTFSTTTTGTTGTFTTGTSGTSGTTSSGSCEACGPGQTCSAGRSCVNLSDGTQSCSLGCTANGGCANPGWTCEPTPGAGLACVPGPGICPVGDCRTQGCGYGETCQSFTSPNGSSGWVCGCLDQNLNTVGNCGGNPSGATVCDYSSGHCRLPEDFDPCNTSTAMPACASGYTCVGQGPNNPSVCVQTCNTSSDCVAQYTSCQAGLCEYNLCTNYFAPCTRVSTNDGTCDALPDNDGGVYGLCLANGVAQPGSPCTGINVTDVTCAADGICVGTGSGRYVDGGLIQTCYDFCNAGTGSPREGCPPNQVCESVGGSQGGLVPGLCQ